MAMHDVNWRFFSEIELESYILCEMVSMGKIFFILAHPLPPYIFKILKHFKMVIISPKGFNTVVMLDWKS